MNKKFPIILLFLALYFNINVVYSAVMPNIKNAPKEEKPKEVKPQNVFEDKEISEEERLPSNNVVRHVVDDGYKGLEGFWDGIDGLAKGLNTTFKEWRKIPKEIVNSSGR